MNEFDYIRIGLGNDDETGSFVRYDGVTKDKLGTKPLGAKGALKMLYLGKPFQLAIINGNSVINLNLNLQGTLSHS